MARNVNKTDSDYTPDWAVAGGKVDYRSSIGRSRMPIIERTIARMTPTGRMVLDNGETLRLHAAGYYEMRESKTGRRVVVHKHGTLAAQGL